jgi:protein-glutamine gamma-glutamyltransferase
MSSTSTSSQQAFFWTAGSFIFGVLLHADRVPLWVLAVAAICVLWRTLTTQLTLRPPTLVIRVLIACGVLLGIYAQFRTLNGLSAGTSLLIAMGAVKLLETQSARDRGIVIGCAFFLLLAACLDRQSLLRAPLYLLQVWLTCAALALNTGETADFDIRGALRLSARNLSYAIPLAAALFIFFPRIAGSFWTLPNRTQAQTGLSETMSPGSISELTDSGDPAFRVRFSSHTPPPHERYWRGPVLEEFDGYTWSRIGSFAYRAQELQFSGLAYQYEITMEPHAHHWWFALDWVTESPHRRVLLTPTHQLQAQEPVTQQTRYVAVSHTQVRATGELSDLARRYSTKLPLDRNRRSTALAQQLRGNSPSDAAYIQSVLTYFRRGVDGQAFVYTLTPPRLDYNSVDDFLFNTRAGFCGHYASAFVTLMRAAGLPARVVTGYLGGEWNPLGSFFIVRQSDAHAWAEVWLANRGWVRFDPTAVVAPERLQRGVYDLISNTGSTPERLVRSIPWLSNARQHWEALNAWWEESVVSFDLTKQFSLLERLGFKTPHWHHLGWGFASALLLWLIWVAWRVRHLSGKVVLDELAQQYLILCRKLQRATGIAREPHQGPLAYAQTLHETHPAVAAVAEPLLQQYARLRYGATQQNFGDFKYAVSALRKKHLQQTRS